MEPPQIVWGRKRVGSTKLSDSFSSVWSVVSGAFSEQILRRCACLREAIAFLD
jgi:hypothetical protein